MEGELCFNLFFEITARASGSERAHSVNSLIETSDPMPSCWWTCSFLFMLEDTDWKKSEHFLLIIYVCWLYHIIKSGNFRKIYRYIFEIFCIYWPHIDSAIERACLTIALQTTILRPLVSFLIGQLRCNKLIDYQ